VSQIYFSPERAVIGVQCLELLSHDLNSELHSSMSIPQVLAQMAMGLCWVVSVAAPAHKAGLEQVNPG
jgi:hypothetical protein